MGRIIPYEEDEIPEEKMEELYPREASNTLEGIPEDGKEYGGTGGYQQMYRSRFNAFLEWQKVLVGMVASMHKASRFAQNSNNIDAYIDWFIILDELNFYLENLVWKKRMQELKYYRQKVKDHIIFIKDVKKRKLQCWTLPEVCIDDIKEYERHTILGMSECNLLYPRDVLGKNKRSIYDAMMPT